VYPLRGRGYFEHGFACKPFDFDRFGWLLRWIRTIGSLLSAIRYHYELLIGDEDFTGGFMKVRALGVDFRDRGGFYQGGTYREMRRITIEYMDRLEPDRVGTCQGEDFVTFYKQWQVRAVADGGVLEYTATREWPAAPVSQNMMYYHFSYVGTYRGQHISGRGYGEYLRL
jgi:hypothetical protein